MSLEFGIVWPGELEIRQVGGARELRGFFPYGRTATLSDRGRVRKESFESRAFQFTISDESRPIDLLAGHDWGRPLANRQTGSLAITDADDGVRFVATLPSDPPSWILDVERSMNAGLMRGVSPGFRVPPAAVVPDAQRLIPEPGNPGVQIRSIRHAVLREMSVVTSAAYLDAEVELRSDELWTPGGARPDVRTLWL